MGAVSQCDLCLRFHPQLWLGTRCSHALKYTKHFLCFSLSEKKVCQVEAVYGLCSASDLIVLPKMCEHVHLIYLVKEDKRISIVLFLS